MSSIIDVKFLRLVREPSIEAAVHRWVARIEELTDIQRADITVELSGRSRVTVHVTIASVGRAGQIAAATRLDAYVAVSDAFREIRRQLVESAVASCDTSQNATTQALDTWSVLAVALELPVERGPIEPEDPRRESLAALDGIQHA